MTDMIYYDIFDYKGIKTCEEVKKQKREDAAYKVITKKGEINNESTHIKGH